MALTAAIQQPLASVMAQSIGPIITHWTLAKYFHPTSSRLQPLNTQIRPLSSRSFTITSRRPFPQTHHPISNHLTTRSFSSRPALASIHQVILPQPVQTELMMLALSPPTASVTLLLPTGGALAYGLPLPAITETATSMDERPDDSHDIVAPSTRVGGGKEGRLAREDSCDTDSRQESSPKDKSADRLDLGILTFAVSMLGVLWVIFIWAFCEIQSQNREMERWRKAEAERKRVSAEERCDGEKGAVEDDSDDWFS